MTTLLAHILSVFIVTHPAPKPPQGNLDCSFTKQNVYICKP